MKRKTRIISLVMMVIMMISSFSNLVFAFDEEESSSSTDASSFECGITWEDVLAGEATPDEYYETNNISEPISISNGLDDEASISSTYTIDNGTYYINCRFTGHYLRYTSADGEIASSGTLSTLGNSIKWKVTSVSGGYSICLASDTTKYLGVPTSTSTSEVEIVTVSSGSVPNRCIWVLSLSEVGGLILQNKYSSRYLYNSGERLFTSISIGDSGSSTYMSRVWRVVLTSKLSSTASTTYRELSSSATFNALKMNVDSTAYPTIKSDGSSYSWSDAHDFSYTCTSGDSSCISRSTITGKFTGKKIGYAVYTATHKVTGRTYTLYVYVDLLTYKLVTIFGFDGTSAALIRQLYDKVDDYFPSKSSNYRAWICSRLLGGIVYNGSYIDSFKWDNVAGNAIDEFGDDADQKSCFIDELEYTSDEYSQIKKSLVSQNSNAVSLDVPDFAHMQISLSSRLAYYLNIDGILSNIGTGMSDEDISYYAGWLGDLTITDSKGNTSAKNDDYCADLDAENIYQIIISGKASVAAFNSYYSSLSSSNTRAEIFVRYVSYSTALTKTKKLLGVSSLNDLKTPYPDTYNFLCSLRDGLAKIDDYT